VQSADDHFDLGLI